MPRELELGMDKMDTGAAAAPAEPAAITEDAGVETQTPAPEPEAGAEQTEAVTTTERVEPGAAPTPPEEDRRRIPLAALKEEREKRKREAERNRKLEEELAYLRGKMDSQGGPAEKPKKPTREEIEQKYWADPVSFIQQARAEAVEEIKHEQAIARGYESERRAREQYKDWDDVFAEFRAIAARNPHVIGEVKAQQDPAGYIYHQIKMARAMRETGGSIEGLRKKIEAEVRAEYEKKNKTAGAVSAAQAIPKTTAGAPGSGARTSPQAAGMSAWDQMFANKRF